MVTYVKRQQLLEDIEKVYILHHVYEYDEWEEDKLIGIYKTENDAKVAITVLKQKSGFNEYPDGFHINESQLNRACSESIFNK